MRIIEAFKNYWNDLVAIIPDILIGLVFLVIGLLGAKIISKMMRRMLERLHLDSFSERVGLKKMLQGFGIGIGLPKLISMIIHYMLVLFVFLLAAEQMNIGALTSALQAFLSYLPILLTALIIFLIGALIADRIKDAITTITTTLGITGGRVIAQGVHVIVLLIVIVTALNVAGIDTTLITNNILVVMGSMLLAFGVAYGFASKDILKNILSSYYSKGRLEPGMRVRIAEDEGVVVRIDSISLVLDCGDKEVLIPTSKLITERVELLKG